MSLEPFDYRSPADLMDEIAAAVPLVDGFAYLVLVSDPSTAQHIVSIERLETPARMFNWRSTKDEMYQRIQHWTIPRVVPPSYSAMIVLVRTGLCVMGANEGSWARAWRYINHGQPLFSGGIIVVTEHGWLDWATDLAGHAPALERTG